MKLSEFKYLINNVDAINFKLPNGKWVPKHFHVTEVGKISKHFMDCGGVERNEDVVSLQLWSSFDINHRLTPERLLDIITLSEKTLSLSLDLDIEVEYQSDTIGKFGLDFKDHTFLLTTKQTDCLAKDNCGIPVSKPKLNLNALTSDNCCDPSNGCC